MGTPHQRLAVIDEHRPYSQTPQEKGSPPFFPESQTGMGGFPVPETINLKNFKHFLRERTKHDTTT